MFCRGESLGTVDGSSQAGLSDGDHTGFLMVPGLEGLGELVCPNNGLSVMLGRRGGKRDESSGKIERVCVCAR